MADRAWNILSLCSGGGGLDRAAELALGDARVVCHVEREAFAAQVLADSVEAQGMAPPPMWTDLRTFDGRPWRGIVDLVVAGIPCQGNSLAGKRKLADDERDLWPDTARILRELSEAGDPVGLILENVYGLMVPDRKGGREATIRRVLRELAEMGWDAEWCVLPASAVGASHRRDRVFVVAHGPGRRCGGWGLPVQPGGHDGGEWRHLDPAWGGEGVGDAGCEPSQGERQRTSDNLHKSIGPMGVAHDAGWGPREPGEQGCEGLWCGGPSDASLQLGHGSGGGLGERWESPRVAGQPAGPDQGLGDAVVNRRRVGEPGERSGGGASAERASGLPLFAPGPGLGLDGVVDDIRELLRRDPGAAWERYQAELRNTQRWIDALAVAPEVEPAVRGLADGLADTRRDWLRLLGNGVVDLQGAAAIRVLLDALAGDRA